MGIINFGMIRQPLNWITVILMVLIAGIAVSFILKYQTST